MDLTFFRSVFLYKLLLLILTISEVKSILFRSTTSRSKKPDKHWGYKTRHCTVIFKDMRTDIIQNRSLPMIYFVTSTYPRPEQMPELIRLSHTLMHVPRVTWIVADDRAQCSQKVSRLLHTTGLPFTHIATSKPKSSSRAWLARKDVRGVVNRRAALKWIRKNECEGVLYFGDDDNTYDLELFEEIRKTKKISMFPVGLVGLQGMATPLVKNGKVKAFFNSWPDVGKYPVDISGFAINTDKLRTTSITMLMPSTSKPMENKFISLDGFVLDDIEPLADNCTKVLVWHTQTVKNVKRHIQANLTSVAQSKYENLAPLLQELSAENLISISTKSGRKGAISLNGSVVDYVANL